MAAYVSLSGAAPQSPCPPGQLCTLTPALLKVAPSEFQEPLLVAGAILAIVSLVSFTGLRPAFIIGAILSAAVLAIVALTWGTYATNNAAATAALSTITLLVDAVASRPSKGLSEKDSPLNLPVFG